MLPPRMWGNGKDCVKISGGTYTLIAGAEVSGADANGYAADAAISGGTTLTTVQMTSNLYSSGTTGGMGGMGGGGMGGGGMRPGGFGR